jgi:hypothetical protein
MSNKSNLDQSLHLRVTKNFEQKLSQVAQQNGLKTSSLARHILIKYLQEFSAPAAPLWMR